MISGEDSCTARRPLFPESGAVPASAGSELGAPPGRAGALQRRRTGGPGHPDAEGAQNHSPPGAGTGDTDMALPARGGPPPPSSPAERGCSVSPGASRLVFLCCARSLGLLLELLYSSCLVAGRRVLGAPVGALYPHLSFASCPVHFWAACVPDCIQPPAGPVLPCLSACPAWHLSLLLSSLPFSLIVTPAPFTAQSMKPRPFRIGFPFDCGWAKC